MVMLILDDDTPKPPDPFLDDLLSGQARRARLLATDWGDFLEERGAELDRPWPVSIHF